ncbi:hypothetical protein RJ639_012630 [Escallonia herrerae]|uniref:RING-CH-type domain-containing protein n=1 Tax=Escallonia herrerae TaxID=1293975 RepID=A0AA89AT40_9ASTE|nr:hypothetical protein RJ639_012630 [Escallonia herrerae]
MSATEASTSTDIESGESLRRHRRLRRKRRRPSLARSSSETTSATTDGSHCFSGDSDDHSWHSPRNSAASRSHGGCGSFSLSEEVDLDSGDLEVKVHLGKREERDCRICHSRLVGGGGAAAARAGFELGCDCKGDMGAAHKQCAETWFKIKVLIVMAVLMSVMVHGGFDVCDVLAVNTGADEKFCDNDWWLVAKFCEI